MIIYNSYSILLVNYIMKLFLLIGIAYASSIIKVMRSINKIVTYNRTMELKLYEHTPEWYYDFSNQTYSFLNRTKNRNKDFLIYPDKWRFMFSDTTYKTVAYILKFRIKQEHCFDWDKCSKKTFNYYTTCLSNAPEFRNGKRCSFAYAYLPQMYSVEQIACRRMRYVSPFTPTNQPYSFVCIGKFSKRRVDYPF